MARHIGGKIDMSRVPGSPYADPDEELGLPDPDAPNVLTKSLVKPPSAKEMAIFGSQRSDLRICGNCKHFNHEGGQRELARQKFLATLVHEMQWKVEHLCVRPEDAGLCDESGVTLTGPLVNAIDCPGFKAKRG